MTTEYPKYDDYDFTNPHELYRSEKDLILLSLPDYKGDPDSLMLHLSFIWERGRYAGSELGLEERHNPFKKPSPDVTSYPEGWWDTSKDEAPIEEFCPYDCDRCHDVDCPCVRLGCAGENED
jgi:hypothetical protein